MSAFKIPILSCLFFISCIVGSAGELIFKKAPWTLKVDDASGALLGLYWNGEIISENPAGRPISDWGPEWAASKAGFKSELLSHAWNEPAGELTLHCRRGEWLVDEALALGAMGSGNLLAIGVKLLYAPSKETKEPVKFDRVAVSTAVPKKGLFLLPAKRNFQDYDGTGDLSSLGDKENRKSEWAVLPLLIERKPELTLIFLQEPRRDIVGSSFRVDGSSVIVQSESRACGWAYPGEAQEIGPFYLDVFNGGLRQAFKQGVWKLYDDIGLKVVSGTPDWFRNAVVYSFQPGGTIGSGFKDLGGFIPAREELLPQIKRIGFNCVWLLPVEDNRPYWPRDYYKLMDGLGTSEDYAALVRAMHSSGMKVLQDNVPHGGTPADGKLRGNKPWELVFDENGDAASYWCFDYGNPDWQRYVWKVIEDHMTKYGVDGYRIDAIIGSHFVNWQKKDFPSLKKTPNNVPDDWWRSSLEANGGQLPPMPYERGSLTCRQGGMEMLHGIRETVKRCNPNGAVLGEVDHAPYMQEADAIFNYPFALNIRQAAKMSPKQWTSCLVRWLDELKYSEPRGTLRLQYVESHDTRRCKDWLGLDMTKAMMAVTMLIDGIPMIYHDADIGIGIFLEKLIAIRMALPELSRGECDYSTAAPCVFAAVRRYNASTTVALVNLSPDKAKAKLAGPLADVNLGAGRLAVWTSAATAPIATGTAEELKSLELDLKPWGYEALAFRLAGEPSPFPPESEMPIAAKASPPRNEEDVAVSETDSRIDIAAPAYSLSIGKTDGQIISFSGKSGKSLLEGSGFIVDQPVAFLNATVRPNENKFIISNDATGITVQTESILPSGSSVQLVYKCGKKSLRLEAAIDGFGFSPRVGLAFAAKDVKRWQVNSSEGLLDDFFAPRHVNGLPGAKAAREGAVYYRVSGSPALWEAATNPLAFERPSMLAFQDDCGVELSVCDPLSGGLRNAMILDKLAGASGWHAAFFWRDPQPSPQTAEGNGRKSFSLEIKPAFKPLEEKGASEAARIGSIRLKNASSAWIVENDSYSVELLKCGGAIRSLRAKASGVEVLNGNEIYTDKGFCGKFNKPDSRNYASSANDGETAVEIWQDAGRLHMLFSGALRFPDRSLLMPMVWASTEYVFDESSSFRVRWKLSCDGRPRNTPVRWTLWKDEEQTNSPAFLAWRLSTPDGRTAKLSKGGDEIKAGTSSETAKASGAKLPDSICLLGEGGKQLLRLDEISHPCGVPTKSVFMKGSNLFIAWLDGEVDGLEFGKPYETSLTMTVCK